MNILTVNIPIKKPGFGQKTENPYKKGSPGHLSNEEIGSEILKAASDDFFFRKSVSAQRNGNLEEAGLYRQKSDFLLKIAEGKDNKSKKIQKNIGKTVGYNA